MTDIRLEAAVPSRAGRRRCCDREPHTLPYRSRHGVRRSLSDPLKRSAAKDRNCKAVRERQPFWKAAANRCIR